MYTVAKTWRRVWGAEHFFADQDFSMTFFPEKNFRFHGQKEFLYDTFSILSSYFRTHSTTLLLKILGDGCMGRSPSSNFLGDRPPSPPYVSAHACTVSSVTSLMRGAPNTCLAQLHKVL